MPTEKFYEERMCELIPNTPNYPHITLKIGPDLTPVTIPYTLAPSRLLLASPFHPTESLEIFTLLKIYLTTGAYILSTCPIYAGLRTHISLYFLAHRYDVENLGFHTLTRVYALLALIVPVDKGYGIREPKISAEEKWELLRYVYAGTRKGDEMRTLFAKFVGMNWGWYVAGGLVDGRICPESELGMALEEVDGFREDLLIALGNREFLPPVDKGRIARRRW